MFFVYSERARSAKKLLIFPHFSSSSVDFSNSERGNQHDGGMKTSLKASNAQRALKLVEIIATEGRFD